MIIIIMEWWFLFDAISPVRVVCVTYMVSATMPSTSFAPKFNNIGRVRTPFSCCAFSSIYRNTYRIISAMQNLPKVRVSQPDRAAHVARVKCLIWFVSFRIPFYFQQHLDVANRRILCKYVQIECKKWIMWSAVTLHINISICFTLSHIAKWSQTNRS